MDARTDTITDQDRRADRTTGPVPTVSATPFPTDAQNTWRSNLGVIIALVVALASITVVSM